MRPVVLFEYAARALLYSSKRFVRTNTSLDGIFSGLYHRREPNLAQGKTATAETCDHW